VRFFGLAGRGFVVYRDPGGLEGVPKLDELIARQVNVFAERDERVEWKLHGHDQPGDHSERLRAARVRRIGLRPRWWLGGDPTPLRRRGTAVARPSL
jgi:hypothetical protein